MTAEAFEWLRQGDTFAPGCQSSAYRKVGSGPLAGRRYAERRLTAAKRIDGAGPIASRFICHRGHTRYDVSRQHD